MAQINAQDAKLAIQASLSEVKRIETLLANQKRTTARYQELREDNYVSQSMLEDALANERVLQEQLKAAKANMAIHEHNLAKTKVTAPIDAFVDKQISSEGAYVRTGDPIFQIVTTGLLRARLPFPESMASHLKPRLTVRLSTPTSPNDMITAKIKEIKPMTSTTSRALDAIVELNNTGAWKPGSSVKAIVVLATKPQALMVPEQSIVLRPAGKVVYIIENNKAKQMIVETGLKQNGLVEVIRGLTGQETIAVDGAGFLSEGTAVKVQQG
jgi:RND family efflux transporter MFP subunit